MNVDRVFVRSAIRLFASTWARVERNEEIRKSLGGISSGSTFSNNNNNKKKQQLNNWNDYDDYGGEIANRGRNERLKNKAHVNNRYNNPTRNSRKFKRDAQVDVDTTTSVKLNDKSILPLVNSSINFINISRSSNNSQHVSDLNTQHIHATGDEMKSNIDNINRDNKHNNLNNKQMSDDQIVDSKSKRNSWWPPSNQQQQQTRTSGSNKEAEKVPLRPSGTPQYTGGCFGAPSKMDLKKSETFAK
jgi:hypothetical protein